MEIYVLEFIYKKIKNKYIVYINVQVCFIYVKYIRVILDLMNNWYNIFNWCLFLYFVFWVYVFLSMILKFEVIKFWGMFLVEYVLEIGSKMIFLVFVVRLVQ